MENEELLNLKKKTLIFRRLNKRNKITGVSYYGDNYLKFTYNIDGVTLSTSYYRPEICFNINLLKIEIYNNGWWKYKNRSFTTHRLNSMIRRSIYPDSIMFATMFGFYDINLGKRNRNIFFSIGKINHIKY